MKRIIQLGEISIAYPRDSFEWLIQMGRFKEVRLTGICWGRVFFGVLRGVDHGGDTTARAIEQLRHAEQWAQSCREWLAKAEGNPTPMNKETL